MVTHLPTSSSHPTTPSATPGFADLGLSTSLVSALARAGVTSPFPIQRATIPDALTGRDVLGRGATGSGKSLAFLLPLVARLAGGRPAGPRAPRALILAPTRELATQLDEALAPLAAASGLRHMTIFGGVPSGPQVGKLQRGVDIVVACPGRLTDHLRGGRVDLGRIEITVLDEADHMADLGFLPDVRRILDRTPQGSQRLLFSATLDSGVDVLVKRYLVDPVVHHVSQKVSQVATRHRIVHVDHASRLDTIAELAGTPGRVVVFTRTKRGAKRLARQLSVTGVPAVELHGDLSQGARKRNLASFSTGSVQTLVATDIAARGIHVDDVSLVVHADPPGDHKAYVHRSGRTGRAGAVGTVVTVVQGDQLREVKAMARKASVVADLEDRTTPGGAQTRPPAPRDARTTTSGRPARSRQEAATRTGRGRRSDRSAAPRTGNHSAAAFSAVRSGR